MSEDNKPVSTGKELKELEKQIRAVNPNVFEGLRKEQKQAILSSVNLSVSSYRSGPLPAPYELEHYNEIIQNGAERIMIMAEKEQNHRHKIEEKVNFANTKIAVRGQWIGVFVVILGFALGGYLTLNEHDTVGGIVLGSTLVGLVTVFVVGRTRKRQD